MNLKEYAATLTIEEKNDWCKKSGIKRGYLDQLMGGHSQPHPLVMRLLCENSGWKCHPAELMPWVFDGIPKLKVKK